ncbi:hypothetical protein MTO96_032572 [Rhipicephalus appendiculatus]
MPPHVIGISSSFDLPEEPTHRPTTCTLALSIISSGEGKLNGSDSPYRLVQERATFEPDDTLTIQLLAKSSYFRGFLVKAMDEQGKDVGRFLVGPKYKPLAMCSGATHRNSEDKRAT